MDELKRFCATEIKELDEWDSPGAIVSTDASNDEHLILIMEEDTHGLIAMTKSQYRVGTKGGSRYNEPKTYRQSSIPNIHLPRPLPRPLSATFTHLSRPHAHLVRERSPANPEEGIPTDEARLDFVPVNVVFGIVDVRPNVDPRAVCPHSL